MIEDPVPLDLQFSESMKMIRLQSQQFYSQFSIWMLINSILITAIFLLFNIEIFELAIVLCIGGILFTKQFKKILEHCLAWQSIYI